MDENGIDAGIASIGKGLPPAVEGHLDHTAAEPFDRLHLGVRSVVGRDHCAGNAEPARVPGRALRHVAGAGDEDAFAQFRLRHRAHRVGSTPDLEGSDRLQVLQFEIDLGRRIPDVEPYQRGTNGGLGNHWLRAPDLLDAQPGRLHIFTVWPVPVSRARRTR